MKTALKHAYQKTVKHLSGFPFVITHGDFTPFNIFPKGVIDFEDTFMGPAGYDVGSVSELYKWFPTSRRYEFYRHYQFTRAQRTRYLYDMDSIYTEHGLPKISDYLGDFNFAKGVWFAVRMQRLPKLQQFRYKLLKSLLK